MIKLAQDTINHDDMDALASWLRGHPERLTQGPLVERFEEAFARHLGRHYAVFCNSGSSANLLAYWALGMKIAEKRSLYQRPVRVLAPAVSWATTVMPAIQFGWNTRLVDAEPQTLGMDPLKLAQALHECEIDGAPIEIVSLVHVLGIPARLHEIRELRARHGFHLLEDCCAALGSRYPDNTPIGTVGDISTFSFYFGHQLSTIEGGFCVTDDHGLHRYLRLARAHGWKVDLSEAERAAFFDRPSDIPAFNDRFTFHIPGFNVRGTDLQAFLGLRQLERAESVYQHRASLQKHYREKLHGLVHIPHNPKAEREATISFGALASDQAARDAIAVALQGVSETRPIGGGNMARQPFWRSYGGRVPWSLSVADQVHVCGFQLPVHPSMTFSDVDRVCDAVTHAVRATAR